MQCYEYVKGIFVYIHAVLSLKRLNSFWGRFYRMFFENFWWSFSQTEPLQKSGRDAEQIVPSLQPPNKHNLVVSLKENIPPNSPNQLRHATILTVKIMSASINPHR